MSKNNSNYECDDKSVYTIIQLIKDRTIDPDSLTKEQRQPCVEFCIIEEGYTRHQVSKLFNCCDRTIKRDIEDIRKKNALTPDVEFAKKLMGDVYQKFTNHSDYLVRLAKSSNSTVAEKIGAIATATKVLTDLVELLQLVGYMPSAPKQITGDIFHHQVDEESKSLDQLKNDLVEVQRIAADSGVLNEARSLQMKVIEKKIEAAQLSQEIIKIQQSNNGDAGIPSQEDQDEK